LVLIGGSTEFGGIIGTPQVNGKPVGKSVAASIFV
jgi:hypothetical protein